MLISSLGLYGSRSLWKHYYFTMSVLAWLKNSPKPNTAGLPNPCLSESENEAAIVVAGNTTVDAVM